MSPISLKLKIGVYLGITLTVAMIMFTVLVVRHNSQVAAVFCNDCSIGGCSLRK